MKTKSNKITLTQMLHRFFTIIKKDKASITLKEVDPEEPKDEELIYKKPSKGFKDFKEGQSFVVEKKVGSRAFHIQYAF